MYCGFKVCEAAQAQAQVQARAQTQGSRWVG